MRKPRSVTAETRQDTNAIRPAHTALLSFDRGPRIIELPDVDAVWTVRDSRRVDECLRFIVKYEFWYRCNGCNGCCCCCCCNVVAIVANATRRSWLWLFAIPSTRIGNVNVRWVLCSLCRRVGLSQQNKGVSWD